MGRCMGIMLIFLIRPACQCTAYWSFAAQASMGRRLHHRIVFQFQAMLVLAGRVLSKSAHVGKAVSLF
jgi:hypothetical protein